MSYVYYVPIIVGIGGILWYYWSNSNNVRKPGSGLAQDNKPAQPKTTTVKPPPSKINNKDKVKPKLEGKPVKIFYGSQTGTAEDFSHKLAGEGKKYGFAPEVVDLEEYDNEELKNEPFVIFLLATYGEGEPTDNARAFDEWIADESRSPDELANVEYTVFGLGNKTYEKYNYMGRKVDKRMEELGAKRVFKKGEGDDDGSLEDDFAAWKREMWPALCTHFNMPIPDLSASNPNDRRFRIQIYEANTPEIAISQKYANIHVAAKKNDPMRNSSTNLRSSISTSPYDIKNPYVGKLVINRELHTPKSDRSCRHIEIEIGSALKYEVGDHLGVFAENESDIVEEAAKRLGVSLDMVFSLYPVEKGKAAVLGPCTVRKALAQYTDLSGSPRKSFLRCLAHYATNEDEKKKLLELSDEKNNTSYQTYIKDDMRTVLCVLRDFPSVNIPFDHFIEAAPKLGPRMYSISSSIKETPGRVHITAVVVTYETPTGRLHKGVCTTWLSKALPTSEDKPIFVPVFVEKANFKLPKDPAHPIIMVGPGTGLAPFRGFIQERKHLASAATALGDAILFFGCRSTSVDYIYSDELEQAEKSGNISKLVVAFSRESEKKVYVQHKMQEHTETIYTLLCEKKGYLYICGDARVMAKDVHQTVINVVVKHGGKSEEQAEQFLTEMKQSGRYLTDVWF